MTENEIIEGCIREDPKAQRMLYKKYKTYLLSAALKYVHNKYEAEDVLQEAMISIFKNPEKFKGDCLFKNWLYKITTNKAINHYNKEKRESLYHIDIEDYILYEKGDHSFEDKFLASDQLTKAMRILQIKSPAKYMYFRLFHIEDMSYKDIEEDIGASEGVAKSQVSRAMNDMRENLISVNTTNA